MKNVLILFLGAAAYVIINAYVFASRTSRVGITLAKTITYDVTISKANATVGNNTPSFDSTQLTPASSTLIKYDYSSSLAHTNISHTIDESSRSNFGVRFLNIQQQPSKATGVLFVDFRASVPFKFAFASDQAPPSQSNLVGYMVKQYGYYQAEDMIVDIIAQDILKCEEAAVLGNPIPIVLDIGANLGAVTLVAAARGCRVIMVEAQQDYVDLIQETISVNGWSQRVTVYNAVASARTGQDIGFGGGGAFGSVNPNSRYKKPSIAVSDLVPEAEYENVKLLKVDVEGYDEPTLQGCLKLLHGARKLNHVLWELKGNDERTKMHRSKSLVVLNELHKLGHTLVQYPHNHVPPNKCLRQAGTRNCTTRDRINLLRCGHKINKKSPKSAEQQANFVITSPCCSWAVEDIWASRGVKFDLSPKSDSDLDGWNMESVENLVGVHLGVHLQKEV